MNTCRGRVPATLSALTLAAAASLTGCGAGTKAPTVVTTPTPTPMPTNSCSTAPVTITHTAAANSPQLVVLSKNTYPQALCNDGTSAAYVLRHGAGAAANRWIISLQGGGECFDQATCASRAASNPSLVSTASFQANPSSAFGQGGLLGTTPANNPDFYDASIVQILYCSSDDWSGAKASSAAFNPNDPNTWSFQGRTILNNVLDDLKTNHNLAAATEVMLTGQSAGEVGVFANANPVAKLIPSAARYVAYSDAGYGNGVPNFLSTGTAPNYTDPSGASNQVAKRIPTLALWNASGDPVCSAATLSDPTSQVNCYSGQTLLAPGGTITLPMLVSVVEKDTNQLGTAGIPAAHIAPAPSPLPRPATSPTSPPTSAPVSTPPTPTSPSSRPTSSSTSRPPTPPTITPPRPSPPATSHSSNR